MTDKQQSIGEHSHIALPATAHPDLSSHLAHHNAGDVSNLTHRSQSPISRSGTPSNIAPQHLFDASTLTNHDSFAPSLPTMPSFSSLRQGSPSASSLLNGHSGGLINDAYEAAGQAGLKTRVSELEVINDLFRGRVAELENSEMEARRGAEAARESEALVRSQLEEALGREDALKRRVEELEKELGRPSKRAKLDSGESAESAVEETSTTS